MKVGTYGRTDRRKVWYSDLDLTRMIWVTVSSMLMQRIKGNSMVALHMKMSNKLISFLENSEIFDYVLYDHNTGFDS